jgi:uncharacterized protein (DUF433 family)
MSNDDTRYDDTALLEPAYDDTPTTDAWPWLEFEVQPFIDGYGWLQWSVVNEGSAPAPAGTPAGHWSVVGQDQVEVVTLADELAVGQTSGEIAADLTVLTPEDGEYAVRCAVGSFNFEVRYVVESGTARRA